MLKSMMSAAVLIPCALALSGCDSRATVSYQADIQPLLNARCAACHLPGGDGSNKSGFVVASYETVMKGTQHGPVIVAGDALSSSLYRLVSGKVDPSIQMPHQGQPLSEKEIALIETWIDRGARNN